MRWAVPLRSPARGHACVQVQARKLAATRNGPGNDEVVAITRALVESMETCVRSREATFAKDNIENYEKEESGGGCGRTM
eukprot:203725-Alexandrium_andersonii.AAC.1